MAVERILISNRKSTSRVSDIEYALKNWNLSQ